MKLVVLAFLLLLAVASIVSGSPAQSGIVANDAPVASVVPGDPNKSGIRSGRQGSCSLEQNGKRCFANCKWPTPRSICRRGECRCERF